MQTSGPCFGLRQFWTRGSFLSQVPYDVIDIVEKRINSPGVSIFCRKRDCSEVVIHHSLDNQTPQKELQISAPRHCLYGSPVPHTYRTSKVTLARKMLDHGASPLDSLTVIDSVRGSESRPAWVNDMDHSDILPAMPCATVSMSSDRLLVARNDMSFVSIDTTSGKVSPTSLTFATRNTELGRAFLGAKPHSSHWALFSGTHGAMYIYDPYSDASTHIGRAASSGSATAITCMQTVPHTDTIFVGYDKRATLYDFRTGFAPVMSSDAPMSLWTSAAFFSEHGLASWNSLVYDHTGFHMNSHCQYVDIRMPAVWGDLPHWNLPLDIAALWALSVHSTL